MNYMVNVKCPRCKHVDSIRLAEYELHCMRFHTCSNCMNEYNIQKRYTDPVRIEPSKGEEEIEVSKQNLMLLKENESLRKENELLESKIKELMKEKEI